MQIGLSLSVIKSYLTVSSSSYYDSVLASSPERYYRHDESSGVTIIDSISAKNGSYQVAPTLNQASLLASGDGRSVNYAASGNAIIPMDSDFNVGTGDWTLMFIAKTNTTSSDEFFLDLRQADNTGFVVSTGGYAGSAAGSLRFGGENGEEASSTTLIDDTNVHHCAIRCSATLIEVFVAGSSEDSVTSTTSYTRATGNVTIAKNSWGGDPIDASIDELTWHKRALSNTEIAEFAATVG